MTTGISTQEAASRWIQEIDIATQNFSYSDRVCYKVSNPGREILLEAVKIRQDWLMHLDEPIDDDILLAAVNEDGYAISNINNQSEALKLAAIQNQRGAIEYIKNPSIEVQLLALTHDMEAGYFDSENLAFYGDKFSDEALALVNPALILMRQLYDENQSDVTELVELYDSVQPFEPVSSIKKLPDTLVP